jgi:hypothetical protein
MISRRWRPLALAGVLVVVIWVVALAAYSMAKQARMTAAKVEIYIQSVDLANLSPEARAKAIDELAKKLNALSFEERRKARMDRTAWRWFEQMTEEEKSSFVEQTMPSGFKQMLGAFEQLPEDKRRRAVDDALKNMREARSRSSDDTASPGDGTNGPALSKELETRVKAIGLSTFYTQSSARTKAELAPVLEELQRVMESGRPLRQR